MNENIYRDYAELLKPKSGLDDKSTELPHKKLSDIMKIELLEDKTADEIKHIWLDYHSSKDVIAATIPTETYELLIARGKKYPLFIFPLPRSQGFEFFLLQFASNTVHFTPLLCYQVIFAMRSRSASIVLIRFTDLFRSDALSRYTRQMLLNAWTWSITLNSVRNWALFWCAPRSIRMSSMFKKPNAWPISCNCIIPRIHRQNWIYWSDSLRIRTASNIWMS